MIALVMILNYDCLFHFSPEKMRLDLNFWKNSVVIVKQIDIKTLNCMLDFHKKSRTLHVGIKISLLKSSCRVRKTKLKRYGFVARQ